MNECPICLGRGRVRLTRRQKLKVTDSGDLPPVTINDTVSEYPCPECEVALVRQDIEMLRCSVIVDERQIDRAVIDANEEYRKYLTRAMGDALLRSDNAAFSESRVDPYGGLRVTASVPVVRRGDIKRKMIMERQRWIDEVEEAIRQEGADQAVIERVRRRLES